MRHLELGDDRDLVLDDRRTEINGEVIWRAETIRELLPIDDDRDARVIEAGTDREVDDPVDRSLGMRFSIEKKLCCARLDCSAEEPGKNGRGQNVGTTKN